MRRFFQSWWAAVRRPLLSGPRTSTLLIIRLFLISLLLSGCQLQDSYSGKIILDGAQVLPAGQTLDGDLLVLGGRFEQDAGATIHGAVHITGGQVALHGAVSGNVTLLDGELILHPTARLHSDLTVLGGQLSLDPAAQVGGQIQRAPAAGAGQPAELPASTGRWLGLLLEIPLLMLMGLLAARFWPSQMQVVGAALRAHPLVCAATGLLAMLAGLSLAILMAYTLLLLPASGLLLALMLFGATFGAAPVAFWLGGALLRRLGRTPPPAAAALLGMVALALLAEGLRLLPLAGDLLVILFLVASLGASLLTRFGGQPFRPYPLE